MNTEHGHGDRSGSFDISKRGYKSRAGFGHLIMFTRVSTVLDKSIRRLGAILVFLQYLLNKCKYQRQTFSTLSRINITRYVKI